MTFGISVRADIKGAVRYLNNIQKKQIPFATSQALNDVAFDARKALQAQALKKLDKPTRFTINGFQVKKSTKRNLTAVVFIEAKRWKYLKYQVLGGTRRPKGKAIGLPTSNVKLNKFGNVPGKRRGLVKNKRQFIATIGGITGVWEKRGGKRNPQLRLMHAMEPNAQYRKRFPFYKIVEGVVRSKFVRRFNKRMAGALRTAR